MKAGDGRWSCSGGCQCGFGEACGAAFRIEDTDAVGENGCGIGGERGGERVGGVGGAGIDGEVEDDGAGSRRRWFGGLRVGFAADFGSERCGSGEAVNGAGGSGPVEEDAVADALGGEVVGNFGEVEGWRARWAGAGAGDEERC